MDWFVNYWRSPNRDSGLNLAVARVIICFFAAWKMFAFPFSGVATIPIFVLDQKTLPIPAELLSLETLIAWEQGLAVVSLVACGLGIMPGLAAFVAAATMTHLTAIIWPLCYEKNFLLCIYFLLLYGLHRHDDVCTWHSPAARRAASNTDSPGDGGVSHAALGWFLLALAVVYAFAGFHKVDEGGWWVPWATPRNMAFMLERRAVCESHFMPPWADWALGAPLLLGGMAWATLLVELGLLAAVLAGWPLAPLLLGLAGMHLGIRATMNVNYFTDMVFMYLVFIPWDSLLAAGRRIAIRTALATNEAGS